MQLLIRKYYDNFKKKKPTKPTRNLLRSMKRQKKKRKPFLCLLAELFQCFYLYDVDLRSEEVSSNRSLPAHRSQSHDGKPTQCKD